MDLATFENEDEYDAIFEIQCKQICFQLIFLFYVKKLFSFIEHQGTCQLLCVLQLSSSTLYLWWKLSVLFLCKILQLMDLWVVATSCGQPCRTQRHMGAVALDVVLSWSGMG